MKHNIAVIGSGYVGLVTGACLSDFGIHVTCVDVDADKINKLNQGIIPIYEPGLEKVIERNVNNGRLFFTTDIKTAVENTDVIFIAVGTPPNEDGSADLKYVEAVARDIARYMNNYKVIVNKSTVPVGTGQLVKSVIKSSQKEPIDFDIVSNPEFLREGCAVEDFMHPDRIVIGLESTQAKDVMQSVYRTLHSNKVPFVYTNIETAELTKYASNAFLAMKITFINEVANLCDAVGADVLDVAYAMGLDERIGSKFLQPGPGYGGSCFPKDTKALSSIGKDKGINMTLVETTVAANENQKSKMVEKVLSQMQGVQAKTIAVLGLAFKPETDDMRDAPAITIIQELSEAGAMLNCYDPAAMPEAKWRLAEVDGVTFVENEYEALRDADAVLILTEWNQFRCLDLDKVKSLMKQPYYFFDLRNIYDPETMLKRGFTYSGVGRGIKR